MPDPKNPFLSGLLAKMWETFVEKFLVPIVMAAIMGGFTLYQQRSDQATVDRVYQQVAEKLNTELPRNLESLRNQLNAQGEEVAKLRTAVLELHLRHRIEKELLRAGAGARVSTPRARPGRAPAAAPQPDKSSEEPFRALKPAPIKRLAPLQQRQLPARLPRN